MSDLVLWIREYQRTKDEIFLKNIIEQFEPAIRKAVFHVSESWREDARQELMIAIWMAVEKIEDCSDEGGCVKYIASTIHNRMAFIYQKFSKQYKTEESVADFWDEVLGIETATYSDVEIRVDMERKIIEWSEVQKKIAEDAFFRGASDSQIAKELCISRQYVNREKKKLAKKLIH